MTVQNKPTLKKKGSSWKKKKGKAKVENHKPNPPPKAKSGLAVDNECFHCGKLGHWKRNCKTCLASMKDGGSKNTSTLGIIAVYITEIFLTDSCTIDSWVFDTGSVAHICNSM